MHQFGWVSLRNRSHWPSCRLDQPSYWLSKAVGQPIRSSKALWIDSMSYINWWQNRILDQPSGWTSDSVDQPTWVDRVYGTKGSNMRVCLLGWTLIGRGVQLDNDPNWVWLVYIPADIAAQGFRSVLGQPASWPRKKTDQQCDCVKLTKNVDFWILLKINIFKQCLGYVVCYREGTCMEVDWEKLHL